jgi:hypothetical protein
MAEQLAAAGFLMGDEARAGLRKAERARVLSRQLLLMAGKRLLLLLAMMAIVMMVMKREEEEGRVVGEVLLQVKPRMVNEGSHG